MGEAGTYRVIALRNADKETLKAYVYGEGLFIGHRRPPNGTATPFGPMDEGFPSDFKNPCIMLDGGGIVWGCQCWWGPVGVMKEKFTDYSVEMVDVAELDNPAPSDS